MTDDALDPRLLRTLRAYADGGTRPIDATAIATASAAGSRGTVPARWTVMGRTFRSVLLLGVLALLILGILVALVGSRQRLPAPFGPARNGLIACSKGGDVFLGDPATGATETVLGGPSVDTAPFWSLDGTRVISLRVIDGEFVPILTDARGQDAVVLGGGPFVNPVAAAWSPTGQTFAIASDVAGATRLWLVRTDGSGATMVAPDLKVESFAFRPPDGREILIRGEDRHGVGLYVVDAAGGSRRTLVPPERATVRYWDLAEARYSPDGSRIAYQRHDEAQGVTRLHVMDADDPTRDRIVHMDGATFEGWPVWSPDGTRVVIIPSFSPMDRWGTDAGWDVPYTIVRVDGAEPPVQTGPRLPQVGAKVDWSPDGTKLLMLPNFGDRHHLLLDANGGPAARLPWDCDLDLTWQRLPP